MHRNFCPRNLFSTNQRIQFKILRLESNQVTEINSNYSCLALRRGKKKNYYGHCVRWMINKSTLLWQNEAIYFRAVWQTSLY